MVGQGYEPGLGCGGVREAQKADVTLRDLLLKALQKLPCFEEKCKIAMPRDGRVIRLLCCSEGLPICSRHAGLEALQEKGDPLLVLRQRQRRRVQAAVE